MVRPFWTTEDDDWEDPIGRRRRVVITFAVAIIIGFLMAGVWGPGVVLGRGVSGDRALADKTLDHLRTGAGLDSLAVAEVDAAGSRTATVGDRNGHWQLGSLTQVFTGHLLADAIERGEVQLSDPLHRHLTELTGTDAGQITLGELASQHSGLPRELPSTSRAKLLTPLTLRSPDSPDPAELIAEVGRLQVAHRGEYAPSDLSAVLLGHALARAAGQPDWGTLAQNRLLTPLGMRETLFTTTVDSIPVDAVPGHLANGRRPNPSVAGSIPAGCCTWTTAGDMATFAQAVLSGRAPGMAAVDPIGNVGREGRIGLFWQESAGPEGQRLLWKDGGTLGSSSIMLLDRVNGRAVVVLSNTATPVDRLGAGLIADTKTPAALPGAMEVIAPAIFALFALWTVRRAGRATRRTQLICAGLDLASVTLLTAMLGSWVNVPGWVHGIILGIGAAGLLLGVRRSRDFPWIGEPELPDRIQVGISVAVLIAILVILAL